MEIPFKHPSNIISNIIKRLHFEHTGDAIASQKSEILYSNRAKPWRKEADVSIFMIPRVTEKKVKIELWHLQAVQQCVPWNQKTVALKLADVDGGDVQGDVPRAVAPASCTTVCPVETALVPPHRTAK